MFNPEKVQVDNIVVIQELLHSLRRKKGRRGSFILKLDIKKKAYDRIDLNFLREVLQFIGFKVELQELIMDCIITAELAVCLNGEQLETFKPTRRQQ